MTYVHRPTTRKRAQAVAKLPLIPALSPAERQRSDARQALARHTLRPVAAQRQAVQAPLRAATLDRQEVHRLRQERQAVQAQLGALPTGLERPLSPVTRPVSAKPTTSDEWVTVLRHRAEGIEGQRLDDRAVGEFRALQRQVARHLAQSFRSDRGNPQARYTAYGEQLATLQRHALSAPVARVVMGLVPPAERLPLQRATDEALQRLQAQETAALTCDTAQALQRQLAELDAEATQPVLARIQARRGAGNPLPEAVRRHLEQGLNHDLSRVRIHDDAEADKLAKGVNAIAFASGTDIFFRSGHYDPNTRSGLELLAHEVTHTVQQSQGRVGSGIDPDAGLEAEARSMGAMLASFTPDRSRLHAPSTASDLHGPATLRLSPGSTALTRTMSGAAEAVLLNPFRALGYKPAPEGPRHYGAAAAVQRAPVTDQLSRWAQELPGYRPLITALGRDPLTGQAVRQDPAAILSALEQFVPAPFQEALRVVRQKNLLGKVWTWFTGELGRLRLGQAVTAVRDALPNVGCARTLLTTTLTRVKQLAVTTARKLADIAIEALTAGLGPVGRQVMATLSRSGDVVTQVIRNPGVFANNLLRALGQGFVRFGSNARSWMEQGVGTWLTGATNVRFPTPLNAQGVLMAALAVMDLTYDALKARLLKELGPGAAQKVALAERASDLLMPLARGLHNAAEFKGAGAQIGQGLKTGLQTELQNTLVSRGVQKIALMFSPVGAAANGIMLAWNTIQTVIDRGRQIMGVITSALSSVQAIAAGNVTGAAQFIEGTIGRSIPVVLTFLGRFLGLGNIGARITQLVQGLKQRLGIDRIIGRLVTRLKTAIGGVRTAGRNAAFAAPKNASEARNQTYADESSRTLQALKQKKLPYDALRAEATNVARSLERRYNRVIDRPAKMTISFPAAAADRRDNTLDYRIHIGPNDTNLTGSVPAFDEATATKDQVRAAIDGAGGIIAFMYALSRGESPGGISRQKLDGLWSRKEIRDDVIKARFRGALNAGEHEWIPTNLIREVIDRTSGTVSGIQAADWINLQHRLRTDTTWIVFRPEYGERLNYSDGKAYFVFKGHVGAMYLRTATRAKELTTHSSTFHDELRRAFDVSKTVNQSIAKARAVIKQWVWNGVGGPGINDIHPQLLWTKGRLSLKDPRNYSLMKSSLARQFVHINTLLDLNRS